MRAKLDENMPNEAADVLRRAGWDFQAQWADHQL